LEEKMKKQTNNRIKKARTRKKNNGEVYIGIEKSSKRK